MPKLNKDRPIKDLAQAIRDHWDAVYSDRENPPRFYYAASEALYHLRSLHTASAKEIHLGKPAQVYVQEFLQQTEGWRGEVAHSFKQQLSRRLLHDN